MPLAVGPHWARYCVACIVRQWQSAGTQARRGTSLAEQWPDFSEALHLDGVLGALVEADVRATLARFEALYQATRDAPRLDSPTIPRVIHQIWLGSPLPRPLRKLSDSWRAQHPDWEIRLWTDREVDELDFGTRDLYDEATCWGQKSDLLRAELIDCFGGVYVDLDYECFRPIDDLALRFDFFGTLKNIFTAYLGWPAIWRSPIVVCNSLFGARPGHPVMRGYLDRVRSIWHRRADFELQKDELPRMAIAAMGGFDKAAQIKDTGVRTFIPFGDVVTEHVLNEQTDDREILLPPLFFNPVMAGARTLYLMPDFWDRCRAAGIRWPAVRPYTKKNACTFASHLSRNSWV